jgi:hypothetical protein
MQPILVDGGKFAAQTLVEIFNDPCVALHDALSLPGPRPALEKVIWNAVKSHYRQEQPYA